MKQRLGAAGPNAAPLLCGPADAHDELSGHFSKHRKSEERVWPELMELPTVGILPRGENSRLRVF